MIRSSVIRLFAVAAAIAAIPALAGCATGVNAETTRPFNTTDGASANFHDIAIRNMFVLGAAGGTLPAGESASLFVALVNEGRPDQLTAASAPGTASSVTIRGGAVKLLPGQPAFLTGPEPHLILERLKKPLNGGQSITVTLYFENAGAVTLRAPVMARQDTYATFLPPPLTPEPSATVTGKKAKPSPSPSASPGSTLSPSPTTTP